MKKMLMSKNLKAMTILYVAFPMESRLHEIIRKIIWIVFLVIFSINGAALAGTDNIVEVDAEGSYPIVAGESIDLVKKVALFNAKRNAIVLAEKYFSHNRLIEVYELDKDEIFCLAARELHAKLLEEWQEKSGKTSLYWVRIRTQVHAFDILKAEIEAEKLAREEEQESYREEMEQHVLVEIDPGRDMAKVYRLLREKKWRIMAIYLNHLEIKYPNWDSVYMSKAIMHYLLHEPVFMKQALSKACRLGNQIACYDLTNIKKVHKQDFGVIVID